MKRLAILVCLLLYAGPVHAGIIVWDSIGSGTSATNYGEPIVSQYLPPLEPGGDPSYVVAFQPVTLSETTTITGWTQLSWGTNNTPTVHWNIYSSEEAVLADPLHGNVYQTTTPGTFSEFSLEGQYGMPNYVGSVALPNLVLEAGQTYYFSSYAELENMEQVFAGVQSSNSMGSGSWLSNDGLGLQPIQSGDPFITGTIGMQVHAVPEPTGIVMVAGLAGAAGIALVIRACRKKRARDRYFDD